MTSSVLRLAALLGLLLPALPLTAQEDVVKLEFLTLCFNGSVKELYYRNGKDVAEMEASPQGIGAPTLYKGPRLLALYASPADLAPPEGAPPPKPVLTTYLPSRQDRALLVFAFDSKGGSVPGLKVYGIDTGSMREGDYRLFNFSRNPVYAIFNEKKKVSVPPGKDGLLSSAGWRSEVMDMNVQFGAPVDGKIQQVYSSVWGHRPERRMFIFVFDRPDKNRPLDIRMFYDVPAIKSQALREEEAAQE